VIPAWVSRSGYVVQFTYGLLYAGLSSMTGPPPVPFGSTMPVHMYSRLGFVGPSIEQW
jgi:hypothetical protein